MALTKPMLTALKGLEDTKAVMLGHSIDEPEISKWASEAAGNVVDYEGYLVRSDGTKESEKQRSDRMECHRAYQGVIKELAALLKQFDSSLKSFTGWEAVFKVYNQINPLSSVVSGVVQETGVTSPSEQKASVKEDLQASSESSTPKTEVDGLTTGSSVQLSGNHGSNQKEDIYPDSSAGKEREVLQQENKNVVGSSESEQLNNKEETRMADLSNLQNMAQEAIGAEVTAANAAKPEAATSAYQNEAVATVMSNFDERIAWTNKNPITKLVCNAEPQVLRIPEGSKGKATGKIDKLMEKFSEATGYSIRNAEDTSFPNIDDSEFPKAKAVLELIQRIQSNPEDLYEIALPNPTYAVKGVVINGGTPIPNEVFIDEMMLKSCGFTVNTKGLVQGSATKNAPNGTTFELGTATVKKKAKQNGEVGASDAAADSVQYKRTVRISNKAAMLADKDSVLIVYPTNRSGGKDTMKNVRVYAGITVGGNDKVVPASFKYKCGEKVVNKKDKDGNVKPETVQAYKTFSVKLTTQAYITVDKPAEAFASLDAATIGKFGKAIALKSAGGKEKEIISTDDQKKMEEYLKKSGLVKALQYAAAGKFDKTESIASMVNEIKAKGDNAKAEAAAEAAAEVAEDMNA